jgi:protein required for attachment to host cells
LQISNACIIVADGGRGRLFSVVEDASGPDGVGLVERESLVNPDYRAHGADSPGRTKSEQVTNRQAGDVHPIDARRDQHRLELERRFAREIAERVAQFTKGWAHGSVVLVAEPRLLGLLREPLHRALHPTVELKELAKDYSRLTASELRDHLALNRMIPARRH